MDRIPSPNWPDGNPAKPQVDKFGAGKHGWRNEDASNPASQANAIFFNSMQENLVRVVEAAGLTPDGSDADSNYDQLTDAIVALVGAQVSQLQVGNWTKVTDASMNLMLGATYGAGVWLLFGGQTGGGGTDGGVWSSADGVTATLRLNLAGGETVTDVFGNGSLFEAVTVNGRIFSSPDGITWTERLNIGVSYPFIGVTYGNGVWVAVGGSGGGVIYSSADGLSWTARSGDSGGGAVQALNGVTFGNGTFVAVGYNGEIQISADGINWTDTGDTDSARDFRGVGFGNGLFVAGGDNGRIETSPDGTAWTVRSPGGGSTANFYRPVFSNGRWLLARLSSASGAAPQTSVDGMTWEELVGVNISSTGVYAQRRWIFAGAGGWNVSLVV